MTSVSQIALDTHEGRKRFVAEHEMFLKIIVHCWEPTKIAQISLDFSQWACFSNSPDEIRSAKVHLNWVFEQELTVSSILLALQANVRSYMSYTVKTHIWPFQISSPKDVADGEGWVNYIGLSRSEAIPGPEMNFSQKPFEG